MAIMAEGGFEFTRDPNGSLDIESAVFQALGAASMCWSQTPKGVFESTWAKQIGERLLEEINRKVLEAEGL